MQGPGKVFRAVMERDKVKQQTVQGGWKAHPVIEKGSAKKTTGRGCSKGRKGAGNPQERSSERGWKDAKGLPP